MIISIIMLTVFMMTGYLYVSSRIDKLEDEIDNLYSKEHEE